MKKSEETILKLSNIDSFYDESKILRNVSINVKDKSITTIMGRNGVGKTTLLKTVMNIVSVAQGTIEFVGKDVTRMPSYERVRMGIGYVPQGRDVFSKLSIEENILVALNAFPRLNKKERIDYVYSLFPVLYEMRKRMGGNLSGGQQQQLAIARALVGEPKMLILDEPTEGIQPSIVKEIQKVLMQLKELANLSILLVEQYFDFAHRIADYFYILDRGEVRLEGAKEELQEEDIKKYLTF